MDTGELSALFADHKIRFAGDAKLQLELRGETIRDIFTRNAISGLFTASFQDGSIQGIDLPALLASAARSEDDDEKSVNLGSETSFSAAEASMFINDSIATIIRSSVQTNDMDVRLFGRIDLHRGNLSLRALDASNGLDQAERLFMGGTLEAPLVSLKRIQKSGDRSTDPSNFARAE